ncbi:hypothetical protein [Streptomyces thermolineatus]|uniref:hypothetical protein n=1 Tax=Streptomyces thermolineatus TaxID=44033 RepID=UPI00384E6BD9
MSESKPSNATCPGGLDSHETPFRDIDLTRLKNMVANSNPDAIEDVAESWKWIYKALVVGVDGDPSVKEQLEDAVNAALRSWEGASADAFAKSARKIITNVKNGAPQVDRTAETLRFAAKSLRTYKSQLDQVNPPNDWERGADKVGDLFQRSDDDLKADFDSGNSTTDALEKNRGQLSLDKERQLEGAIIMEYLGAAYMTSAKVISPAPPTVTVDDVIEEPGSSSMPPASVVPLPGVVTKPRPTSVRPGTTGTSRNPGSVSPLAPPRDSAIVGGAQKPVKPVPPQVGTVIDGITTAPAAPGNSSSPGNTGNAVTGGGTVGGSIPGGGGVGSAIGAGRRPGIGRVGGAAGRPGVPGAGTAGGPVSGRAGGTGAGGAARGGSGGAAGRGGMPGGQGVGGSAQSGSTGRTGGGLARQRGGVIGGPPRTGAAPAAQGGSGLHRSRGGTQAGGQAPGRGMGHMAGAPGTRRKSDEEKRREGERPDYLVEDEETWESRRDVTPRVID